MLTLTFKAEIVHWRGPAPFFFAQLPDAICDEVAKVAKSASYGWGVVPVEARIDGVVFTTSLFPKQGRYLLPLKDAVRKRLTTAEGDPLAIEMTIGGRAG